ncbi:MAG: hypothetical protein QXR26_08535 [Candidatus Caldarchaeum sp.]
MPGLGLLKLKGSKKQLCEALYREPCTGVKGDVTLPVMPSFNGMLQGRSITDLSLSKLVRGPLLNTRVFDLDKAQIIALDGSVLGSVTLILSAPGYHVTQAA